MKSLINKLTQTPGPPGYEGQIRQIVLAEIKDYADEIRVDNLGNLIARKGSKSDKGKRIMLAAHMDEIGVIATHIDEDGFIRFTNIGGVFPRYAPGGRVRFLDGTPGVIGTEKIESSYKVPPLSKMYIDVGASSQKDCHINVGDVAVFERPLTEMGDRMVSKAMDDRISVAILIEALKKLKQTPHEIYFVFSVQEEVGVRGATTAAFGVDPEIGLAIDVTRTGDTPKGITMEVSLGSGPAIKVKDSGMISDPRVVDWMVKTAQKAKIPYQLEVLERGGTDARAIQLTRSGVPAGCLSIPCRYVHSPSEMVDFTDVENALNLLLALLKDPIVLL
ncbi:MAG: M42 family metallopeptidase [Anaerolineales bacterium]|nr:M42 family metallopeptidase [Chloroflexota bacterium]MBL6981925.1 M42 family metallopeptidase [Anaerolineales bacterium]